MKVALLATTNSLVRDIVVCSLMPETRIIVMDLTHDSVVLKYGDPCLSTMQVQEIELAHACITCSLREALVPFLSQIEGGSDVVVALPVCSELLNVAPMLSDLMEAGEVLEGFTLASTLYAADIGEISLGLREHTPLEELELNLFEGDDRCLGEVQASNVGYADLVATMGEDPVLSDLVEHLRPLGTERLYGLENISAEYLFSRRHDPDAAIACIHPATTKAWGGPTDRGVWTLDLHSHRPFHPGRLRENISRIAPAGTCVRGCFWIPGRTSEVSALDGSGGQVSVGSAGPWVEIPFTHVIVVGMDDLATREDVEQAFSQSLMTEEEIMAHAHHDSSSFEDTLDEWFSQT